LKHVPVLLNECLNGLKIDPAGYLSGRHGGRRGALPPDRPAAERRARAARLISLDQYPYAVQTARARLAGLPATVVLDLLPLMPVQALVASWALKRINGALLVSGGVLAI